MRKTLAKIAVNVAMILLVSQEKAGKSAPPVSMIRVRETFSQTNHIQIKKFQFCCS